LSSSRKLRERPTAKIVNDEHRNNAKEWRKQSVPPPTSGENSRHHHDRERGESKVEDVPRIRMPVYRTNPLTVDDARQEPELDKRATDKRCQNQFVLFVHGV
jgi:hypothetical protein